MMPILPSTTKLLILSTFIIEYFDSNRGNISNTICNINKIDKMFKNHSIKPNQFFLIKTTIELFILLCNISTLIQKSYAHLINTAE